MDGWTNSSYIPFAEPIVSHFETLAWRWTMQRRPFALCWRTTQPRPTLSETDNQPTNQPSAHHRSTATAHRMTTNEWCGVETPPPILSPESHLSPHASPYHHIHSMFSSLPVH